MNKDFALLARLKDGDPQALEEAISRYAPYAGAVARRALGQFAAAPDVEEIVADAFVALWQNAGRLREDSNLKYWLAVVTRNRAFRQLGHTRFEEALDENLLPTVAFSAQDELEKRESAAVVRGAVDSLGPEDRDIFLRHYFWRQTVVQISQDMGINESTVKSRLKRGREKLKTILQKEEYGV